MTPYHDDPRLITLRGGGPVLLVRPSRSTRVRAWCAWAWRRWRLGDIIAALVCSLLAALLVGLVLAVGSGVGVGVGP